MKLPALDRRGVNRHRLAESVWEFQRQAEVTVNRDEFERRQQTDASQSALQWILDIGGAVQVEGNETWLSSSNAADELAALSPLKIVSVDLTGCMLTDESLTQLIHFANLQTLDLSNTPLASLEFLPKLEQLTELNLRHLQMRNLSTLHHVESLRRLDLSHSPFDASIATALMSASNLQSLNLANTNVDRFLLSELNELSNLLELDVRDDRISKDADAVFTKSDKVAELEVDREWVLGFKEPNAFSAKDSIETK